MKKKKKILDWLLGLGVTLFFLFITSTGMFDFTDNIEMKIFDFGARIAASGEKNSEIELVVITDDDLSELGPFPWPRHILAQAVGNLARAGAKVIAINILLAEPEESEGLRAVRRLKEDYELLGLVQQGAGLVFYSELSGAVADLDNDAKFYKALENAGNVVLPVYFDAGSADSAEQAHDFITKHAFHRTKDIDQRAVKSHIIRLSASKSILPPFGQAAAGIGHINFFPDPDGYVRNVVHVLEYQRDIYFPSFPMAIVKLFKGIKDEDMTVVFGEGINLGVSPSSVVKVPVIDPRMRTMVNWSKGPDGVFRQTPFIQVFNNQAPADMFKDKVVIIGLSATRLGERFATPISGNLSRTEIVANSVANILNQRFISAPPWIPVIELAALVFFGLFITFVLPGLKAGRGAVMTTGLLLGYGLFGTSLLWFSNIWLRVASPTLLLILGYALVILRRLVIPQKTEEREEQKDDQGFMGVSAGIADVKYDRVANGFEPSEMGHPGDVRAAREDMDAKPTLGRYEVIGEIGRGAMGVVYRGQDPKIGRKVAIKTVRLSEFDEDIVDEIRDRFYREAESAGLLSHPNIVTIYDCGEENDLAYIAMEYLEGEALDPYTKAGHLLPLRDTLHVVADVLDALDYAHQKDIVHRDIKPANIMKINETNDIKVMDFGIARITSSSRTKPGTVLGTPSYMSPEQVSGKKVDGRSDIFSVGVLLFELLTGEKPFTGEDITSLMFKIAKESHPSPRAFNPKTPRVVEKIIDKALEKNLEKRYQRAGHMAAHLKKVIERVDEILAQRRVEPS